MRTASEIAQDMVKANKKVAEAKKACRVEVEETSKRLLDLGFELKVVESSMDTVENTEIEFTLREGFRTWPYKSSFSSAREILVWAKSISYDIVYADVSSDCPQPLMAALTTLSTYRNVEVRLSDMVMLTVGGKDIYEVSSYKVETLVYEIQKKLDAAALLEGREYGMTVSTRSFR